MHYMAAGKRSMLSADTGAVLSARAVAKVLAVLGVCSGAALFGCAEDKEAVFELKIDPKCPFGSHKQLFCAGDIKSNSQSIPHNIGAGGVLRVVPPKNKETKVAATSK